MEKNMSEFIIPKEKTVCFSGHRPEKLPDGGDISSPVMGVIRALLHQEIASAIDDGYTCFITGLARGIDLMAGDLVLDFKRSDPRIQLVAAVPYRAQPKNLRSFEKFIYGCLINEAADIVYISEEYTKDCMQKRNKFMIDNSSRLIAAVSSYRSGTGQTIRLAEKAGIEIRTINIAKIASAADEAKSSPVKLTF